MSTDSTITFEALPGPTEILARSVNAAEARRFLALAQSELTEDPSVTLIGPSRWCDDAGVVRTGVIWAKDDATGTRLWFRLGMEAFDG